MLVIFEKFIALSTLRTIIMFYGLFVRIFIAYERLRSEPTAILTLFTLKFEIVNVYTISSTTLNVSCSLNFDMFKRSNSQRFELFKQLPQM